MATIVVLDDDEVVVELLEAFVGDMGHQTIAASDLAGVPEGTQADLVLADLITVRPYRPADARAWVARLRDKFHAPIIVITGHAAAVGESDRLGADAVVAKPFDLDALFAAISRYVTS